MELVCGRAGHKPRQPAILLHYQSYWFCYRWKAKSWSLRYNLNIYQKKGLEIKSDLLDYILTQRCCQFEINQLQCYAT